MKNRIKNLLINGFKASEITSIVGCSPGYIAQLIKDDEFKASVEEGKLAAQAERTEDEHIDTRYQSLEHKIISSVEEGLAEASLGEKVRALEMIEKRAQNKFARKYPAQPGNPAIQVNVVSLQLPNHAMRQIAPVIQINEQSEIVAIDNQHLAPMSSDGVKNLFARITEAKIAQQTVLSEI
jgi:hypothetical protein